MTRLKKTALFFILIGILSFYGFWMNNTEKKPIEIKPIQIKTLSTKKENISPKEPIEEKPVDILSKLRIATHTSSEGIVPSKEEVPNKILSSLSNKIAQQEIKAIVIKKKPPTTNKIIIKKEIVKKESSTKPIKSTVKKIQIIAIKKKAAKKHKVVVKKTIIKKEPNIKHKENNKRKVQIVATKKEIAKKSLSKPLIENKEIIQPKQRKNISREEEVILYNNKYANTLEVVNVSENFEINEEATLPDSYYFEPILAKKSQTNNAPLEFVDTLGVVNVSTKYESNFSVSQKVEIAKEGIVNISSASLETEEIKKLEFVDTLGIIEVSSDFETINATSYLD